MSRRPAAVTQADVARVIRAAKQAGAAGVEVQPGGAIRILLQLGHEEASEPILVDAKPEIVL